jgi:hypothetical protein
MRNGGAVPAETSAVDREVDTVVADQTADDRYADYCDDFDYDGCRASAVCRHLISLRAVDCHSYCPRTCTVSAAVH